LPVGKSVYVTEHGGSLRSRIERWSRGEWDESG